MSLFNILSVASTAMQAQTIRLNTISSNLSNQDSIAEKAQDTYKAKYPVFQALAMEENELFSDGPALSGVKVSQIVEGNAENRREFMPGHPNADKDGFVTMPNINAIEEMANMISASRSYQDSIQVFQTAKTLMMKTISSMEEHA